LPATPSTPQGAAGAPAVDAPDAAGGAANAAGDHFSLVFRDDFDTLDAARWQIMTHSWDSNLALFSAESVKVDGGLLSLSLLPAADGTTDDTGNAKQFLGAEVRSRDTVTYGRVTARANFAAGSAVISALVTIYTPWPADNWNELDMEFLGANPDRIQFNTMVYTGEPTTAPVTESVTPTQDPHEQALAFDPSSDFHTYSMEWTPEGASFSIDEQVLYRWTTNIALMNLAQNVLLTIWASSSADWAGPVTDATSHAVARYDWLELYRWQ
jgi:beta-glucanase (GH16 family)